MVFSFSLVYHRSLSLRHKKQMQQKSVYHNTLGFAFFYHLQLHDELRGHCRVFATILAKVFRVSVKRQIELIGVWTRHFNAFKDKMSRDERIAYAKRLKTLCNEIKKQALQEGYKI